MRPPAIPTRPAPDLELPGIFSRLRDVVYNLWWSWSPEAHLLYNRLAPTTWRHYRNPIDVLIDVSPAHWRELAQDADFTRAYHSLIAEFDAYMAPQESTWFETHGPERATGPYAYFSTEYGWHECLQIYSGGLGVLSGDHSKSASDLGLPMVGVGLMYQNGYFNQTIDSEGLQQHFYPDYDLNRLPLLPVVDEQGIDLQVPVAFPERTVHVRVWKAMVGRVPVLLLDTDLPINHPADRPITSMLYVQGREMRLCQEIVLGIGGVSVLRALGIEPKVWHINEGHSALLVLERIREIVESGNVGFEEARERVTSTTVFTTHTPVPAGNESFDVPLVERYLGDWCRNSGIDSDRVMELGRAGDANGSFNLTVLALRCAARTNGVSGLHGTVANQMWQPVLEASSRPEIEHVTNGVHVASWIGPELRQIMRRHDVPVLSERLLDDGFAAAFERVPDHELWTAHLAQKSRLIALVREKAQMQFARHGRSPDDLRVVEHLLDPEALTIGFARRFATYKRADLLLRDEARLLRLMNDADRPLQFVFAGKAHPADRPGQEIIRRICQASFDGALRDRMVFLENYDMRVGRHIVQGVDVWLNTPRRPHEASGTSGMKAAVNGVLNCSILDGWWCEGFDREIGWAIGEANIADDEESQDRLDAESLYEVLESRIVPAFYTRQQHGLPEEWIRRMRRSIAELTPRFSSTRMVRDYVERYYLTAEKGTLVG